MPLDFRTSNSGRWVLLTTLETGLVDKKAANPS